MKAFHRVSLVLAALFVINFTLAQNKDVFFVPQLDKIKLSGYAGDKLNQCIENGIMQTDEDYFVAPFRKREDKQFWQSEFWGKWITSAIDAYQYNKDPKLFQKLQNAVNGLIATQSEDGYIGNYAPEHRLKQWDIWGTKYCLLGLISFYEISGDKKALNSAVKLANHIIAKIYASPQPINELGNHRGMAASSIMEPIVRLYNITKTPDYLKFADYIVKSWTNPEGPELISKALQNVPVGERFPIPRVWYGPLNGRKAYEMMSCYEGLLELYRVTGKSEYFQAVKNTAESIRQSEIFITGSGAVMENWYGGASIQATPAKHPQETCVTATWMKLCLQMLRSTGDAKWANEIERTFYNSLLGAMTHDGSTWNKYTEIMGVKNLGENQCGMTTNCCIASGPRGMVVFPKEAFMTKENGVVVNFYTPATAQLPLSKKQNVNLLINTEYPKSDEILIEVSPQKPANFDVLLRIPDWSKNNVIAVNGTTIQPEIKNGYAVINRSWKKGDIVKLNLEMKIREFMVKSEPSKYALIYGPIVLASDRRYQEDPMYRFYTPAVAQNKVIPFEIAKTNKQPNVYLEIKVPFAREATGGADVREDLILTDFASAGNTWNEKSAYLFWFQRPLDFRLEKW